MHASSADQQSSNSSGFAVDVPYNKTAVRVQASAKYLPGVAFPRMAQGMLVAQPERGGHVPGDQGQRSGVDVSRKYTLALVMAALAMHSRADAGLITSIPDFNAPGALIGSVGALWSGSASHGDDANETSLIDIPFGILFSSPRQLEAEIAVEASSEKIRFPQGFLNSTGVQWQGFLFELGFVPGDIFSTLADLLDLHMPVSDPAPGGSGFLP